jgi:hypothetical protein
LKSLIDGLSKIGPDWGLLQCSLLKLLAVLGLSAFSVDFILALGDPSWISLSSQLLFFLPISINVDMFLNVET